MEKIAKKIALVGSMSVGKTTLLNSLRNSHAESTHVGFIDEAARVYFTKNPDSPREHVNTQGAIQELALSSEQNAHGLGYRVLLCDRSVIDAAVYLRSFDNFAGAEDLFERVRFWLPTYDKFLVLSPHDVPYEPDEFRIKDAYIRLRVHEEFLRFLEEKGLPFEILGGTIEQRAQRIMQIIEEKQAAL